MGEPYFIKSFSWWMNNIAGCHFEFIEKVGEAYFSKSFSWWRNKIAGWLFRVNGESERACVSEEMWVGDDKHCSLGVSS